MDEVNETGILLCNFSGMIKTFCPACVRGAARKGSAADKKASAAALPGCLGPECVRCGCVFYDVCTLTGRRRAAVCRGRLTDRSAAGRHSGSDTPERCRPGQSVR